MNTGTMDEWMLNDVLECSVCLEQLDSTSKVLPCQHTFCKRCLEEIVCSRKELRCPECRVLVETKVDELPCNILLIRILEGMKNAPRMKSLGCVGGGVGGSGGVSFAAAELVRPGRPQPPVPLQHSPVSPHSAAVRPGGITDNYAPTPLKPSSQVQPCARALYAYEAKEHGDLSFMKGDVIILRKKIDLNWFSGELAGKCGFFPASYVQVITPLPTHTPQCKALYDFRMNDNDEKDCLAFSKGEVITVLRRVDENWIEGKLGERIGIFPISFVEMNSAARSLMKLSPNIHSGPSRVAPPTPSSDSDTTPLITSANSGSRIAGRPCVSSSTSSSSSSSTSSSTTTSSSSSSTTPSPSSPPTSTLPSSHPSPVQRQLLHHHQQQQKLHLELLQHQQRDKRHGVVGGGGSVTASPSTQGRPTPPLPSSSSSSSHHHHRHPSLASTEMVIANSPTVLGMHGSSSPSTSSPPLLAPPAGRKVPPLPPPSVVSLIPTAVAHSAARHKHNAKVVPASENVGHQIQVGTAHQEGVACSSTPNLPLTTGGNQSLIHVAVPIFYVALYPYKPQKEDELELRKAELYTVSEKCQDGWFKGTSLRTGHCGVFPGNYVQAAKSSLLQAHFRQTTVGAATTSSSSSLAAVSRHAASRTGSLPLTSPIRCARRSHHTHHHHHGHHTQMVSCSSAAVVGGSVVGGSGGSGGGRSPCDGSGGGSLSRARAAAAAVTERTQGFLDWARSMATLAVPPKSAQQQHQHHHHHHHQQSPHSPKYQSHTSPRQSAGLRSQGAPELPPRVVIAHPPEPPAAVPSGLQVSPPAISQSWHGTPSSPQQHSPSPPTPMSRSLLSAASAVTPPNVSVGSTPSSSSASPTAAASYGQDRCVKMNKKKQKTPDKVSFVKMLSIKKKNPKTPSPSAYSMDNPVFVDCPSSYNSSNNSPATSSPTVTHARSESCPSDAVLTVNAPQSGHRKSNSIDGSTENANANAPNGQVPRPKQPAPLVRERFRCIVPYPPNSEYELELKVGDIIYVHRKREDGWYKGTLHRTGKTGLFPGSFVESF